MTEPIKWIERVHALSTQSEIDAAKDTEIAELRTRVAELERTQSGKPVAWLTPDGEGFRIRFSPPTETTKLGWDALYTSPPARQPMTEEEIEKCYETALRNFRRHQTSVKGQMLTALDDPNVHFARAVEAHHKIGKTK